VLVRHPVAFAMGLLQNLGWGASPQSLLAGRLRELFSVVRSSCRGAACACSRMSAFQSACGNNSLCSSTTCRRRSRHARAVAASSNVSAHTGESKPSEEADVALPPASLTFISSVSNPYVKHAVKLGTSRSYREETRSVLLAGGKLLAEVAQECGRRSSGSVRDSLRPRVLLLAEGAPVPDGLAPERVIRASTDVLRKVPLSRSALVCWEHCALRLTRRAFNQVAGVENGDSTDAVAELPMPPMVTPSIEQVRSPVTSFPTHGNMSHARLHVVCPLSQHVCVSGV